MTRFFIDHGVVHDHATGRHLTQAIEDDYPQQLCDLLNDLHDKQDGYREALLVLVELKQMKRHIEAGTANDSMKRYYEASKEQAWIDAELMLRGATPPEEKERTDAALRACDGLSTMDLAGNKRGWLAEICYDAHKLDEPYRYGAQKCLAIVKEMRAAIVQEDSVDYGILSRIEYRLQKVVDAPVAPLPSKLLPLDLPGRFNAAWDDAFLSYQLRQIAWVFFQKGAEEMIKAPPSPQKDTK